jgi:anti-sigma B factor antagonist
MEGFSIKIDYYPQNNAIVIIKLLGYVDQSNSHQIEKVISDLIQSNKQKFVFDLSELIYMSSAGWGIFVGEVKTVREVGGDIKVASMSPEIYDVFQVLEFYHILEDYSSVEEAVASFVQNGNEGIGKLLKENLMINETARPKIISRTEGPVEVKPDDEEDTASDTVEDIAEGIKITGRGKEKISRTVSSGPASKPMAAEVSIDLSKLPLTEKIKKIVAIYPLLNVRQIRKMLNHEKFGSVRISVIKLYRMLRLLNLHTKKNRYRFYRSV